MTTEPTLEKLKEFVTGMDRDVSQMKSYEEAELELSAAAKRFEKIARCKITISVEYHDEAR